MHRREHHKEQCIGGNITKSNSSVLNSTDSDNIELCNAFILRMIRLPIYVRAIRLNRKAYFFFIKLMFSIHFSFYQTRRRYLEHLGRVGQTKLWRQRRIMAIEGCACVPPRNLELVAQKSFYQPIFFRLSRFCHSNFESRRWVSGIQFPNWWQATSISKW